MNFLFIGLLLYLLMLIIIISFDPNDFLVPLVVLLFIMSITSIIYSCYINITIQKYAPFHKYCIAKVDKLDSIDIVKFIDNEGEVHIVNLNKEFGRSFDKNDEVTILRSNKIRWAGTTLSPQYKVQIHNRISK